MAEFNWMPDFVIEETVRFNTLISEFENGIEQRRAKVSGYPRKWRLFFKNRNKTETDDVKAFFVSKKGALTSFTWNNPNDSIDYWVRFLNDDFNFLLKAYQVYDFEIRLIEVK
jgi:phage-related protein